MTSLVRRLLSHIGGWKKTRDPYVKSLNGKPTFDWKTENHVVKNEAEKQQIIWKAFGVDYKRELSQLEEAKNRLLIQLNNSLVNDELKEFIEQIVREEVKKYLGGRGFENRV